MYGEPIVFVVLTIAVKGHGTDSGQESECDGSMEESYAVYDDVWRGRPDPESELDGIVEEDRPDPESVHDGIVEEDPVSAPASVPEGSASWLQYPDLDVTRHCDFRLAKI